MNIKTRPFTQEEFQKLLWVSPEPWRSIFHLAYLTGLRISDLLLLRSGSVPQRIIITEKKTGNVRNIQVNPSIITAWNRISAYSTNEYLLPFRDQSSYRKAIYRYSAAAQIPLDRLAFHSIRKTTATQICNSMGIVAAYQFLGHKRISTTMKYIEMDALEIGGVLEALQVQKELDHVL